jgi:hypothetical protein
MERVDQSKVTHITCYYWSCRGSMLRGLRNNSTILQNSTSAAAMSARVQALQTIQIMKKVFRGLDFDE